MIRVATATDVPGIDAVISAVYAEYGFIWDLEDLQDFVRHYDCETSIMWVFEDEGEVVGAASLLVGDESVGNVACDCSLHRVYVHPEHRRKGIATALSNVAFDVARDRGLHRMAIWSDKRFDGAHKMYESMGASRISERELGDINSSFEWGYVLELTA